MFVKKVAGALTTASLLAIVAAQDGVPADLTGAFNTDAIEIQASFGGDASEGFASGVTIDAGQTQTVPTFALGDSSGINTQVQYAIAMVDTTCDKRVLHYYKTNFAATNEKTKLASDETPIVKYAGPGSFQEKGSRSYTFLMWRQPPSGFTPGSPTAGQEIDALEFGKQQGLGDARAGVAFKVELGGETNCGGGIPAPAPPADEPSAAPPAPPVETVNTAPPAPPMEAPAPPAPPMEPPKVDPPKGWPTTMPWPVPSDMPWPQKPKDWPSTMEWPKPTYPPTWPSTYDPAPWPKETPSVHPAPPAPAPPAPEPPYVHPAPPAPAPAPPAPEPPYVHPAPPAPAPPAPEPPYVHPAPPAPAPPAPESPSGHPAPPAPAPPAPEMPSVAPPPAPPAPQPTEIAPPVVPTAPVESPTPTPPVFPGTASAKGVSVAAMVGAVFLAVFVL